MDDLFAGAEVISSYSRAQAIEDGVLRDAGELAREAGFVFPVALTAAAWADTVAWPKENAAHQDETGRLWDVLTMARHAIAAGRGNDSGERLQFTVYRVPNVKEERDAAPVVLALVVGPGDRGEGVLTIMQPHED